jgi:C-5 cytosine-specific DNA methylase
LLASIISLVPQSPKSENASGSPCEPSVPKGEGVKGTGQRPLAIDLYCGLGGWAEGFLAEGYDVIGFDIERRPYPAQLVLQDVTTLHGSQFRNAAVIVASPPCQEYSYRAMPWKRAKALPPPDNTLFDACFRIQREASEAAGRYIPLVIENVKGAQKWVGRARWHFGSYYLWGDVPALMPQARELKGFGKTWFGVQNNGVHYDQREVNPCRAHQLIHERATKGFSRRFEDTHMARLSSRSAARKQASAEIAKIPFPLAEWIARVYRQTDFSTVQSLQSLQESNTGAQG